MDKTKASGGSPAIKEIQNSIISELQNNSGLKLSTSAVAEWRLWTYIVAVAIHTFQLALDLFRKEIDEMTTRITPGTARWYVEMCKRFQHGHKLAYDETTAMYYYEKDAPADRIVKIVAISENAGSLTIKVAKLNASNKIEPLTPEERYNFMCYIDVIKFAGDVTGIVSTNEDKVRYDLDVFFDPAIPNTTVRANVLAAIETFKIAFGFDSMLYAQRFTDTIMSVPGVITCKLRSLSRKGVSDPAFVPVDIVSELESGYFEYDPASVLTVTSVRELNK